MIALVYPYIDNIVAAANFTTVVMMVILGSVTSYLLISRQFDHTQDIRTMLIGVTIEAYAWGLHRLYWGTWRTLRAWGYDDWNQWFVANSVLSLIPSTLVLIGLSFILAPMWGFFTGGHTPGRRYYIVPWLFMVSVWWLFFFGIFFNDPDLGTPPPKPATVFQQDMGALDENSGVCDLKERGKVC